jgi:orotate phosphoribosyltransferase
VNSLPRQGRKTPYFFNAGLFSDGASLGRLGEFYAQALLASGIEYDQLFGPAYKGITLAAATAIALAASGHNVPYSFNRKEAKDHGEGGTIVGAALEGRVVIVDDVITAGTSIRESVATIGAAGAKPAGVLIALDRMERGQGESSAVQDIRDTFGIPVVSIATLDDVMTFIDSRSDLARMRPAIADYRARYGTH